jgi:cytoskeletal protein CcmA (bactofilin family)
MSRVCSLHRRALPIRLLAVTLLGALLPAGALAAEMRKGDTVTVGPDEVLEEDLYVFGSNVSIQGTVHGDVLAFARSVDISGTVDGDVLTAAADTRISGEVSGSIRAASATLIIGGQVEQDAVLAGRQVRLEPGARVGGDAFLAANTADVQAPVGGDVKVAARNLTLGAPVGGDASAEVETLHLTDAARIDGTLRYRSAQSADIAQGATVVGPVLRLSPEQRTGGGPVLYIVGWARWLVGLFALGLLLVLVTPDFARRAPATLRQSPWKSLGWGAVCLVGVPLLAVLFFLVGALLGGWWIGLLALGLYALALALCFPVVGIFLGWGLLERFGKAGPPVVLALLLGLVLLTLASLVPVLGALIALATMLFGLGALALTAARGRRPLRSSASPQTA